MKLLLLKLVICFTAVLAAPADKQKRDILPGDPRYGTEHHHHHEHQHHEQQNEVQISKSAGDYVGSYTVPDDTETEDHSFQVQPQSSYGPPNHTLGKALGTDVFVSGDTDKAPASILVPSTSYGIPDTTQILNNYLGPIIDDKNTAIIKTTIQEQPKFDTVHVQKSVIPEIQETHHVQQPAVLHKHVENIPQTVSLPQVKVTASHVPTATQGGAQHNTPFFTSSISNFPSYVSYPSYSSIPLKTVDRHVQVQVPQPYQVPVTKNIAVPVPVPHTVEVPKPYYVRVPQPVQVTVDRPYPVEVPRPVPYPVHHYVKTSVPVAQHHVTVDTSKTSPLQTFFDNTQSTFQNVLTGVPTFSNPLEGFSNPFENFDLSSFPTIPFLPSLPSFIPQPIQGTAPPTTDNVNVFSSTNSNSITVDNPVLKTDTTVTKPAVVRPINTQTKTQGYKPATACAGCIVPSASNKQEYVASNKQEYIQRTDANGGYVY